MDGFYVYYRPYGSSRTVENQRRTAPAGPRSQFIMLSGLVPDTAYSIRMAAYNRFGVSDFSNTAVQKTLGMCLLCCAVNSDNFTVKFTVNRLNLRNCLKLSEPRGHFLFTCSVTFAAGCIF